MAEADPRPVSSANGAGPALRSVDSPRVPDLARRGDPGPEDRRAATHPPCGQNRPGQPALLGEHENDVTGGGFYRYIYIIIKPRRGWFSYTAYQNDVGFRMASVCLSDAYLL